MPDDNGAGQGKLHDYPWYRPVVDGSLEQGDLLFDFPSVAVTSSYEQLLSGEPGFEIHYYDAIVLTQSCDLAAEKVDNVILCPFFRKEELASKFPAIGQKGGEKQVQRGNWESLYLLPPCNIGETAIEPRIVNFRQVFAMPFPVLADHARRQDQKIRLCPPYREHLAQAFARFVMRIGFPIEFRL